MQALYTPSSAGRRKAVTAVLLLLPVFLFLVLFFVWPVLGVLGDSLSNEAGPLKEYANFFASGTYLQILARTIGSALLVTFLCVLVGYPYAYLMTRTRGRMLQVLTGIVLISFFTSVMVRSFAWIILMQRNGIIDRLWQAMGFESIVLRGTILGVVIAMVQIMLPFMIFPLYSAMVGIDDRLERASASLGAKKWTTFWRIYFPLSVPGVVAGSVIVFVTSLGFYIIPGLIGSPSSQLLSHLIYSLINTVLNIPMASTASVVMLLVALAVVLPVMWRFDVSGNVVARFTVAEGGAPRQSLLLRSWAWLVGALLLLPALVVIPISFPENRSFVFPPTGFSIKWYQNFFTNPEWWGSFVNSMRISVMVTIAATVLSVFAALALRKVSARTRTVVRALILTPRIVPGIIIAIAVYGQFMAWRFSGSTLGFVIAHTIMALPFAFIPIAATLEQFDKRFEDASASLGASKLTTFFRIVLPLIRTGLLTGALFAFVISFDEVIVSLFISGPTLRTLPVQMYRSIASDIDPTIAAASTMLLLLTTCLVIASMIFTNKKVR